MSKLAGEFLRMATSKPVESRPLVNAQPVSLKYCECAGTQTPHMHKPGYLECAWCGSKKYERTHSAS